MNRSYRIRAGSFFRTLLPFNPARLCSRRLPIIRTVDFSTQGAPGGQTTCRENTNEFVPGMTGIAFLARGINHHCQDGFEEYSMEQKNLLIAIALSFLIFLGWSALFAPKPVVNQDQAVQSGENAGNATQTSEAEKSGKPARPEQAPAEAAPQR